MSSEIDGSKVILRNGKREQKNRHITKVFFNEIAYCKEWKRSRLRDECNLRGQRKEL